MEDEDDVDPRETRPPYDPVILDEILRDAALPPLSQSRDEVMRVADHQWRWILDESGLVQGVVDDIQQWAHDTFTDTSWPTCPRHPNHPMWYRDGHWWCDKDGVAIVPLGELSRLRSS